MSAHAEIQQVLNTAMSAPRRGARLRLTGLAGVDDPYEAPGIPDLRIGTRERTAAESAAADHALLTRRGLA